MFIHSMREQTGLSLLFVAFPSISYGWCGHYGNVQWSGAAPMTAPFGNGAPLTLNYVLKEYKGSGWCTHGPALCSRAGESSRFVSNPYLQIRSLFFLFFIFTESHENNLQKSNRDGIIRHWRLIKAVRIWHPSSFFFISFV